MATRPTPEYAAAPPARAGIHPERDTFPQLVRLNAMRLPGKVAIREENLGIWRSFTWPDYRHELYWTVTATPGLSGVPVPIYRDSIEKEMQYVVDHAEVRFAVGEGQEQMDKLLHVRGQCTRLECIVYGDPRGMRGYREPFLLSLAELEARGRTFTETHPEHFESEKDGDIKLDTVRTPIPDVEIKIASDGEVRYRSPGVFRGYYKNPEATRQTIEDGWVHSGDAGFLDHAGHLKIIDRARDVSRLADGTLFAPTYLENKLKFSPYNIDLAAVGNRVERRGVAYTSYTDLSQRREVCDLVHGEVDRVNRSLLDDDVLGELPDRRLDAPQWPLGPGGSRARLPPLPATHGAPWGPGRLRLGRRAANGVHRARPHGAAHPHAPR